MYYNQLFYEVKGDGGTPIVFLHGWGCKGDIFNRTIELLSKNNKTIAIDFPGHGKSPEPIFPYGVTDFANEIIGLLNYLKINKVNVVAHSFGARVVIKIASSIPELINKIIITGGAGIRFPNNKLSQKTIWYKRQKKIIKYFKNIKILQNKLEEVEEKLIKKYGSTDYIALSNGMRQTFKKVINEDLTPYLSQINSSTLLIWGENDTETPIQFGKIMEKEIKDSALIIFENSSHYAFLEQNERFNIILKEFFKEES